MSREGELRASWMSELTRLERFIAIAMCGATLFFVAVLVQGAWRRRAGNNESETTFVTSHREIARKGRWIGDSTATVTLIEFGDYECPACAALEPVLQRMRKKHAGKLATSFLHFPLAYHKSAMKAAVLAECAPDSHAFEEIHASLFRSSANLATVTQDVAVPHVKKADSSRYAACIARTDTLPSISESLRLGKEIRLVGTPTILVNGVRFRHVPTESELDSVIVRALMERGRM
jgi:Thioredoxin